MKALSWLNFVLGLWLIVVGFTLSRSDASVMMQEVTMGFVIVVLAAASANSHSSLVSWLIGLAGLWTVFGPIVVNYGGLTASRDNDLAIGMAIVILAVVNGTYRQTLIETHV